MTSALSPSQAAALFDILTHYDTYAEIRNFRFPGSLKHYGPPFSVEHEKPSTYPALQTLVSRFLLTLPGLNNLSDDFWKVQCHDIIENLEQRNLSESYDKGIIGSRRTLATAISALIEYPVRGTYGGFAKTDEPNHKYDTTNADDLSRSFRDFMDACIYGNVLEDLVKKAAQTDDLNDHEPMIKAVHEFVLVNLASLMHYTLILSPKGQYLLKLVDNANRLVPYMMIKQTLRIGNVATMISGLVRIGLAKMSVASLTNWMGITQTQDEGMNLMQHIISTVLSWDLKDLDSRALKIEKEKKKLNKEQLHALKDYASRPREDQEKIRSQSQKNFTSISVSILQDSSHKSQLSKDSHELALEYLNIQLSIRDRKEIINVMCHSTPDHLTQSVRELIDAYEPVIRKAHEAIDLSGTVTDFEYFLKDMIKLAKLTPDRDGKTHNPSVGDFVQLLRKHQSASHTFIHQCCKNGPEVTGWYLEWAKTAASHFKRDQDKTNPTNGTKSGTDESGDQSHEQTSTTSNAAAGSITSQLNDLFTSLPKSTQESILPILDSYKTYIEEMHSSSTGRLKSVLSSPPSKNPAIAKIFASSGHGSRPNSRPSSRSSSPLPWSWGGGGSGGNSKEKRTASPPRSAPTFATTDKSSSKDNTDSTSHNTANGGKAGGEGEAILTSQQPQHGAIEADLGPGAFLARWQDLLDSTLITPSPGSEGKTGSGSGETRGKKPDVKPVVEALGEKFRQLLAKESCYW